LLSLFSDLWKKRGAYPGLPQMLYSIDFHEAIDFYKEQTKKQLDKEAYEQAKAAIEAVIGKAG
jgi:hypothetical protein